MQGHPEGAQNIEKSLLLP